MENQTALTAELAVPMKSGLKLAAIFHEPAGVKEKLPLVILLHGNTGWKEEEHLASLAGELAKSGIGAVRFDAPGSGKSEGSWDRDYRLTNYISAVDDIYTYMVQNFNVDSSRVGLWGHSMGGIVAVYAASHGSNKFAALCCCEPSPGAMSKLKAHTGWQENGGAYMDTENFGRIWLPSEYFIDRGKYETRQEIKNVTAPVLCIAGSKDELVPEASVREIYDAANQPKQYAKFNMDHFYKYDTEILQKVNMLSVEFFKKFLTI